MAYVVVNPATESVYGPFSDYEDAAIFRNERMPFSAIVDLLSPKEV